MSAGLALPGGAVCGISGAACSGERPMTIGVILVAYDTGEVLLDCLESLLAAARAPDGPDMRVLVVDNASPDGTLARLEGWASGAVPWDREGDLPFSPRPRGPVTLDKRDLKADGAHPVLAPAADGVVGFLQAGKNDGFAAGVNRGLETFAAMPEVEYFWILNSDAMTEAETPARLVAAARAAGRFGIIGGRTYFQDPPLMIQTDGGWADMWLGRMRSANVGRTGRDVPGPEGLDYIPGCHMLVSRTFLETAGPMPEDYFLYYEEVDWCLRRGDLPLIWVADAPIHHVAGGSIGSGTFQRGPSALSAYWMARNRLRFVRRWNPMGLPTSWAYGAAKAIQLSLRGHGPAARAAWRGLTGLGFGGR